MQTLREDLRFAFRLLAGSPGFTLVAAVTLAIGIASTATVFTWIDSLLLHPFPGAGGSGDLAVLEMQIPSAPNGGTSLSWLDYIDYRDHLKSVSGVALQRSTAFALGDAIDSRLVWGELVSAGYFDTLGVRPLLGQAFVRDADTPGAYPCAVISERLWRSYFHGDRRVVGKTMRVNRRQMTVIGVAPAGFHGTAPALMMDLWVPAAMGAELGLMARPSFSDRRDRNFHSMIVRLKPGVPVTEARNETQALAATLAALYPRTNHGVSATVRPPWKAHNGAGETLLAPLSSLMGVAVLLLLVVCANVGNLLLARSVARHREFGMRLALGASRWRVARQLMTETLLLGALAAVGGFALLTWMQGALISLVPSVGLPLANELPLNFRILGFTLAVCLAAAAISGLAPALVCFSPDINEALKEGGRRSSPTAAARHMRGFLVIAEVALAAVALIGAGLFLRSFRNGRAIHPGFDTSHVLFGRIFIESTGYSAPQIEQLMQRLCQSLEGQPGIEAVSYSNFTPLSTTAGPYASDVRTDGYVPALGESTSMSESMVAPGYFAALRIPLLEGRDFTVADENSSQPVIIVNQAFAKRYFHGQNAIGRIVQFWRRGFLVVGLARDSKYFSPAEAPRPFMYLPFRDYYEGSPELYLFVRTHGEPASAAAMLRRVVARVDGDLSAIHIVPLEEYTKVALLGQNVAATLMSTLGLMCLLLAAIGIYSVMSYSVSQRTQEIGIRIAMGAGSGDVIGMVVRQGMGLALAGLAVGVGVALALTRVIASLLIHVDPLDPVTFASAAAFLLAISLAAAWLPAHRATRIDPMTALRRE